MTITSYGWDNRAIARAILAGDLMTASDLVTRNKATAVSSWLLSRRTNEEQAQLIVRYWIRKNFGMDAI